MADKEPSPRGRLLTFLIFGGLLLAGILLLWIYWTQDAQDVQEPVAPTSHVRSAPPGTLLPSALPVVSARYVSARHV